MRRLRIKRKTRNRLKRKRRIEWNQIRNEIAKVLSIVVFETLFLAVGAFLIVALGLVLTGTEIDFERQRDVFLGPVLIFGTYGFIAGCIHSGLASRVLMCVFIVVGFFLRAKDRYLRKLVTGLDRLFNGRQR